MLYLGDLQQTSRVSPFHHPSQNFHCYAGGRKSQPRPSLVVEDSCCSPLPLLTKSCHHLFVVALGWESAFSLRTCLIFASHQVRVQSQWSGTERTVRFWRPEHHHAFDPQSLIFFWGFPYGFLNHILTVGSARSTSFCLNLIWACSSKCLAIFSSEGCQKNNLFLLTFPRDSRFSRLLLFPSSWSLPSSLFQAGETQAI